MCEFCNPGSDECEIFIDSLDNQWYIYHQTGEWDDYEDDYVYGRIYINYCPWCGRKL